MLPKVLIFSCLILGAAAYPIFFELPALPAFSNVSSDTSTQPFATTIARAEQTGSGKAVSIVRDSRGHFVSEFRINGRKVMAMVDTGATVIAINKALARRAGFSLKPTDFTGKVGTANGTIAAAPVTLESVQIGRITVHSVAAVVLDDAALPGVLIGMSFLNQLKKFEVQGDRMVLAE